MPEGGPTRIPRSQSHQQTIQRFPKHNQGHTGQYAARRGKPFAAYIYLAHAPGTKTARTEQVTPEVLIDCAEDGTPLGIEVVSQGSVSHAEVAAAFCRLGMEPPSAAELAPLLVA